MLTDAMLREATAEAERFLLSIVPEDGEPHMFSKQFERKIQKLIRRTDHPVRYQVMRIAAAVVLAIVTLFGAVMAVSPEARAAVAGWVKSTFFEFYAYSNEASPANNASTNENSSVSNPASEPVKYEYRLATIPEGYREVEVIEKVDGKVYLYINDLGQILQFTYTDDTINNSLFAKAEKYQRHSAFIHGFVADIYISNNADETSGIVWQDIEADVLFQISAIADREELLKIAQTVAKINN